MGIEWWRWMAAEVNFLIWWRWSSMFPVLSPRGKLHDASDYGTGIISGQPGHGRTRGQ